MPFDLSTAKEVEAPKTGGFDINTAKPVANDTQDSSYYRESTGDVISAPADLSGKQVEYLDDSQNKAMPKENFFGFTNVGNPMDAARGYMRGIITGGTSLFNNLEGTEKKLQGLEQADKDREFGVLDILTQFAPTPSGKAAEIRTSQAVSFWPFGGELTFEEEEQKLRDKIKEIHKIDKELPAVMKAMGLDPNNKSLLGQVGQAGTSLAVQYGARQATGNALLGASIMFAQTKTDAYKKARSTKDDGEAGLSIDEAGRSSFIEAGGTAVLEHIGTDALFKAFGGSSVIKSAIKGFFAQGAEEGSQEIWSILIRSDFNIENPTAMEAVSQVFNAILVGGLTGSPTSAASNMVQNNAFVEKFAQDAGVTKKEAKRFIKLADKEAKENKKLQKAAKSVVTEIVDDEVSPVKDDAPSQKLNKIANQFIAGEEIDLSEYSKEEQEEIRTTADQMISSAKLDQNVLNEIAAAGEAQLAEQDAIVENREAEIVNEAETLKAQIDAIPDVEINKPPSLKKILGRTPQSLSQFIKKSGGIVDNTGELAARDITTKSGVGVVRKAADQENVDTPSIPDNENIDFIRQSVFDAGYFPDKNDYNKISDAELFDAIAADIQGEKVYSKADLIEINELTQGGAKAEQDFFERGIDKGMSVEEIARVIREERGLAKPVVELNEIGAPVSPIIDSETITRVSPEFAEGLKETLEEEKAVLDAPPSGLRGFAADVGGGIEKILTPISTRIANIKEELMFKLRRFELANKLAVQNDEKAAVPFLKKWNKMNEDDKNSLDLALKNGNEETISLIADKYNMANELQIVRDMLDGLYERAKAVGIDVNYRAAFFPRNVKDVEGLLGYLRNSEGWSVFNTAFEAREKKLGRKLTALERGTLANNMLRGFSVEGISLSRKGIHKERTIEQIDKELNQFYDQSDQALLRYIIVANESIEVSKLFGRGVNMNEQENMDNSVGVFVDELLENGEIEPAKARELKDLFNVRFSKNRMGPVAEIFRDLGYLATMGSNIGSTVTQIGDTFLSSYKNGLLNTIASIPRAAVNKTVVSLEDIGIDKIAQEFAGNTLTSKIVENSFKLTGLSTIDKIGKRTLIEGSYRKNRKLAKKGNTEFMEKLGIMFGKDNAAQVAQDLIDGNITEDVKFVMFNDLLDMQPVALSEMPEQYLKSSNGRMFYMLKTFTIKQLDIYRRDTFREIRIGAQTGDKKRVAKGIANFVRLLGYMMMAGASRDLIWSWMTGKEPDEPNDMVIKNLLKAFGLSKYTFDQMSRPYMSDTPGDALFSSTILLPTKTTDNMWRDFQALRSKKGVNFEDLRTLRSIPIGGELYWFWFGGGSAGVKKKSSTGRRRSKSRGSSTRRKRSSN